MSGEGPQLRLATLGDAPAIDALMKASIADLFPQFYSEQQTASSMVHVGHVDQMLIEGGTYFVIEVGSELVACGGWSRRDKLFSGSADQEGRARLLDPVTEPARVRAMFVRPDWTRRGLGTRILDQCEAAASAEGFTRLSLMATKPGRQLYERYGFAVIDTAPIMLPDGVLLEGTKMRKAIGSALPLE